MKATWKLTFQELNVYWKKLKLQVVLIWLLCLQVSAKNWWSATTGRVGKTLDNKRAKIREEVSEGDGWPRDMVWKRERWRCITLSRAFDWLEIVGSKLIETWPLHCARYQKLPKWQINSQYCQCNEDTCDTSTITIQLLLIVHDWVDFL